jgi:uncharacterized membrane protein YgdD (TMEM256/DUF423 family)
MKVGAQGAVLCALGIGIGAFGAHAFKDILVGPQADWFALANRYHLLHSVALVALGAYAEPSSRCRWFDVGLVLMGVGLLIFCGGLYTMAMTGYRALGAIVPIGGLSLIIAWCCLARSLARRER